MPIDVASRSKEELEALIANHEREGATSALLYLDALAELERRTGRGLNFDKSQKAILAAAKDGRFPSYKELADASGVEWTAVHLTIGKHLSALVTYAHRKVGHCSVQLLSTNQMSKQVRWSPKH